MFREEAAEAEAAAPAEVPAANELPDDIKAQLAQFEDIKAENERLNAKLGEANKHTRAAESAAKEAARLKAEKENDFKQLYESGETERKALLEENELLKTEKITDKLSSIALKTAISLNPVTDNAAQDLAEKIAKRLKYTDNSVKVVDINGNLTVSSIDDLKKEILASGSFSHYLKGNQSTGGSASGGVNNSGSSTQQTISRADFKALNPVAQMKHIKSGGAVTD